MTDKKKIIEQNASLVQNETHRKKGVYVVRVSKYIKRVKGKSDIVYIGRGNLHQRVRRLLKLFPGRVTENTKNQKVLFARLGLLSIVSHMNADVWVTYKITDNYIQLEKDLLQKYRDDHIEMPPLNRSST